MSCFSCKDHILIINLTVISIIFLNKKLNRVYPYFYYCLSNTRDIQDELSKIDDDRKELTSEKDKCLANQYETHLRDLTTTEGRILQN